MFRKKLALRTFGDRLDERRIWLEKQLDVASNPDDRRQLKRQIRQLKTAAEINDWLSSPNLRAPT
jgi:hypothetical protein